MERKPQPSFDRFSEKPARAPRARFSSDDRFGGDRGERRFSDRFGGDRGGRFGSDRNERFGERRFGDRNERFGGERREGGFGGARRFGNDRPAFRRFDRSEPRFSDRSGPRAKAVETRRFADRQAFVQTQTVRLDADVAAYFADPAAVNAALRQVIALTGLVKKAEEEKKADAVQPTETLAADMEEATEDDGGDVGETCTPQEAEAEAEEAHQ